MHNALDSTMESFRVLGQRPLQGSVQVAGNKNAALPVLAAMVLSDDAIVLNRIPDIRDVRVFTQILTSLGRTPERGDDLSLRVQGTVKAVDAPPDLCTQIRASFALAGPLLARFGRARLPAPGGDKIGRRPLDTHLKGFEAMGATVSSVNGFYEIEASKLKGADIFLEEMSVLATENLVMAAALAEGQTVLRNCACEPHVQDVCNLLVAMGAKISGIGGHTLTIEGVASLHGCTFEIGPDYIEVGSWIALAAASGGEFRLLNARPSEHRVTEIAYAKLGVRWRAEGDDILVPANQDLRVAHGSGGSIPRIHDAPWPGFPPDLTSIATVLATQCEGMVQLHEWMYESRFFWIDRLIGMGARAVLCDPHRVVVQGKSKLYGKTLVSPDIRAGMALLIAALLAEGESIIHQAQQIDRGYENIIPRLQALGADVERISNNRRMGDHR